MTTFISAPLRKTFSAVKFAGVVAGMVQIPDSENCKPSDLRINKDLAKSGMGAKCTPISFVSGLLSLTCAYAWGQGKLDTLSTGLPPVSIFALSTACEGLKNGAGITSAMLKNAVITAMEKTAALPLKSKESKTAIVDNSNVIDSTSTPVVETVETDEEKAARLDEVKAKNEALRIAAETSAKLEADTLAASEKAVQESAPQFLDLWLGNYQNNQAQALEMLAEMAKIAGYTLTKARTKKTA